MKLKFGFLLGAIVALLVAGGCAPPRSLNMVTDSTDGLQYGSVVGRNIVIDAHQFDNPKIKVTIRNTSGDDNYDLKRFKGQIEDALRDKGFSPTQENDFGIRYDLNVRYSGHIEEGHAAEYGLVGAAAGGIVGNRSNARAGTAMGVLAGATIGAIVGSYTKDNTYIVISDLTVAVTDSTVGIRKKVISFDHSPSLQDEKRTGLKPYVDTISTSIAVYAGGRGVQSHQIASGVRRRMISIVSNAI